MRSLVTWILTEPSRSPWNQFFTDCLRGFTVACILMTALIMNLPTGWL
jgi:hypothetical protein